MSDKRYYVNHCSGRDRSNPSKTPPSIEDGRRQNEAGLAGRLLLAVAEDLAGDLIDAACGAAYAHGAPPIRHDDVGYRLGELDAATAVRGEVADLGDEAHPDLALGKDGRIDHEGRSHALPSRPLRDVSLSRRVVPEPRDRGVGHLARHHHARRTAVLDHGEHAIGSRRASRRVLDGETAAGPRLLAVLDDDAALPLRALARGLALLLELEDDLDLTAGLGGGRHAGGQDERADQKRPEAHAPYPGICPSSASLSQTGFHSGGWSPTASALSLTSPAKAWRTSSLSRSLSRYLR